MSASPASATFTKSICYDPVTKDYKAELDGRLIGYFGSYHTAEVELDRVAFDWLTHGYDAPASALDDEEPEPVNWTDRDPEAHCPDCDGEGRFPSDGCGDQAGGWAETCDTCHGTGQTDPLLTHSHAASWSTDEPPPSDPLPDDAPGEDIDGVPYPRCADPTCRGPHHTWQCPQIRAALFAPDEPPWKDIALGRELCRMRWRNFRAFVTLLLSVPTAHLGIYAESYVAFIRDYDRDTTLTTMDVLKVWTRIMTEQPTLQAA